ncbi:MAG: formylglycine-generating enzyme family protein [Nitrospinaceae bacterium]|nr:formylglycine-generating enzyme family protein [Nitrospinaceae bacterium]NIW59591.1 SUMF1/EgtB/PvdO family nonheme iron enzyme [Nitrospinaceae bacterium]
MLAVMIFRAVLPGSINGAYAGALPDKTVSVAAGEFLMGTGDGTARERPVHKVWLDEFSIGAYEVTNEDYEKFQPAHRRSRLSSCDTCPVTRVTWYEAEAYCRQTGGRLPTEAEWEKAARGPRGLAYGLANRPQDLKGNFARAFDAGAVPVNAFTPNGYGLHQMNGNVWEWVRDWFGEYPDAPQKNPKGPSTGVQKGVRGGAWHQAAYYVHAGMRFRLDPNVRLNSVGFRCVKTKFSGE